MRSWVRLPNTRIEAHWLKEFKWGDKNGVGGADGIAALMVLLAIAHHVDPETHHATVTYDQLETATHLSRAKIAAGIKVLDGQGIISRSGDRSQYRLHGIDKDGEWCQLPAKGLYNGERIMAFSDFTLRKAAELNALKLYLLFAVRRDRKENLAHLTYEKITEYCGVDRSRIKQALSILVLNGLIQIDQIRAVGNEFGFSNAYRLTHLDPYVHMGTAPSFTDAWRNNAPF